MRLCVFALISFPLCISAATNDLTGALQRGLFEEEANRNLDAAAQAYQAVSAQFDQDRKLAATAIFRLGEVYRKQGRTNDAVAQYERIVREFSEEQTLATLSRQNLAGLRLPGQPPQLIVSPQLPAPPGSQDFQRRLMEILARAGGDTNEFAQRLRTIPERALRTPPEVSTDDEEKEIRRIQAMIQNSPDLINAPGGGVNGNLTPLCSAAGAGWLSVAKFLLDNGAAINRTEPLNGWTPLHLAASAGHRAMVDFLLARGADANARSSRGRTPLHIAAENGFQAVAERLVAGKADINAITSNQETLLHLAADKGHAELVKFLISKGAKMDAKDESGRTVVSCAAARGHSEAVAALLAAKANPDLEDKKGRTPLSHAAEEGHLDCVKVLLEAKADPNAGKLDLSLAIAVYRKRAGIAEALLRAGADPNLAGNFSIQVRLPDRNDMQRGGSSFGPYVPLQIAMSSRDVAMVKLLLKHKADPNTKDWWFTPSKPLIFHALGYDELLKAFLDAGADAKAKDGHGQSVLIEAAGYGSVPVKLLLAAGADASVRGLGDATALHVAAGGAHKEVVALLLAARADVNARTVTGDTPLHRAVNTGNKEIVELLLTHGADPNVRDNQDKTPLDLAKSPGPQPGQPLGSMIRVPFTEIAALLRQHGALDDLPKLDRIQVSRPTANFSAAVFLKGTNDWNQFSLLELIACQYNLLSPEPSQKTQLVEQLPSRFWKTVACKFPDFNRVLIRRPVSTGAGRTNIPVRVGDMLNAGDASPDERLQWGDTVEIPEADHPVNQTWSGLPQSELTNLIARVSRQLTIAIKGTNTMLKLSPKYLPTSSIGAYGEEVHYIRQPSCMILPVLQQSELLRASSDLSRVKVSRRDSATGKIQEWTLDCGNSNSPPGLWLRDGDVIEVPDKM